MVLEVIVYLRESWAIADWTCKISELLTSLAIIHSALRNCYSPSLPDAMKYSDRSIEWPCS